MLIWLDWDTCVQSFAGRRCYVSGWGKDVFGANGTYQNTLKEVNLKMIMITVENVLNHGGGCSCPPRLWLRAEAEEDPPRPRLLSPPGLPLRWRRGGQGRLQGGRGRPSGVRGVRQVRRLENSAADDLSVSQVSQLVFKSWRRLTTLNRRWP